ncbi:MAG: M23 family metallopeptidase [Pseudomonadota bacterium]
MTTGSVAKFRRFLGRSFRERQIYHRADGVVHFISMSSRTQIALAVVTAGFLLWVAFATVNVVFKEQIIIDKEHKYRIMETMMRMRIDESQSAYDQVAALNMLQKEQFDEAMRELNGRHSALEVVMEQKAKLDARIETVADQLSNTARFKTIKNGNRLMISPVGEEVTPRQSRTPRLRQSSSMQPGIRFAGLGFASGGAKADPTAYFRQKTSDMRHKQMQLLSRLEEDTQRKIAHLKAVLEATGVGSSAVLAHSKIDADHYAQGGPLIEVADAERLVLGGDFETPPASDHEIFFRQSYRIAANLDELTEVEDAVSSIPLAMPLAVYRRVSSPFGPRTDPFNGRRSMHSGIDIAANWNTEVRATAPGVVTFAGSKPGYGKMVELDHGNGFRTRYAHLNRVKAKKGAVVKLHDTVGLVGSTGRSTGPHLHYEVWFNGKVRNPSRFFEAGRYVFES